MPPISMIIFFQYMHHHHHLLSYIDVLEDIHEVPNPQREVHVRLVMQRVHVVLHEVVGSGVDACNKWRVTVSIVYCNR